MRMKYITDLMKRTQKVLLPCVLFVMQIPLLA